MKSTTFLLAIVFFLFAKPSQAQNVAGSKEHADKAQSFVSGEYKIVFQLSTKDTMAHKALIKQLKNILSVAPSTKIKVVCHGPGLEMVTTSKTTVLKGIQAATVSGVDFVACEFSLKERNVQKTEIISEAGFVPAGILEIVKLQSEGWYYIKSGF